MSIDTLQHPWELQQLLNVYEAEDPVAVLEIGTWEGGTLKHWLGGHPALAVVIDDGMRKADLWRRWARAASVHLHLLQGHSQAPEVREQAEALGPYDWLFIDADHTYDGARNDWLAYRPLVRSGGVVAFHDLRRYEHGQVDQLWAELKPQYRTLEIVDMTVSEPWGGIGVLWVP